MNKTHQGGFTFVELIVVVVILGVLATVGLMSYSTYLTGARDSNRLTQLSDLRSGLSQYSTSKKLPSPENNIQISAGGSVIGYQGYAGEQVLKAIGYNDGGTDPGDETYFTYYMSNNSRDFQLMAFLEEEPDTEVALNIFSQTHAAEAIDYTQRYPTVAGKPLGVLIYTQDGSNRPVQEALTSVNVTTTTETFKAYYSDEEILSGTGGVLTAMIPNKSCKRIQELGNHKGSGTYKVNPTGAGELQVYCDMETDRGGWTKVINANRLGSHWNAYTTSMNSPSGVISSTGGLMISQFSSSPTGEDLEYMFKIDKKQVGPIYKDVNYQAWDTAMGTTRFDTTIYSRPVNTSEYIECTMNGLYHASASWPWSISNTSGASCAGYSAGGGFLITGATQLSGLYGFNTYSADNTWGNIEVYIR